MRKWLGIPLGLGIAIALCLIAVAAPTASAHRRDYDCSDFATQAEAEEYLLPGDPYDLDADSDGIACEDLPCPCSTSSGESVITDPGPSSEKPAPPPKPPKLNKAVARSAARAKAIHFKDRSPLVSLVSFQGCGRNSRRRLTCHFYGRGRTATTNSACRIVVTVTGEGSHAHAKLRASCRSERLLYLTFAEAIPAIREGGEEVAQRGVAIVAAERLSNVEIEATVEWMQTTKKVAEECELRFIARLNRLEQVLVNYGALICRPEVSPPA